MDHTVYFDMLNRCVLVLVITGLVFLATFLIFNGHRKEKHLE